MPGDPTYSYVRRRAAVVCVQCHTRKIKCDLQQRQQGPCLNCLRTNQTCMKRRGLRNERRQQRPPPVSPISMPPARVPEQPEHEEENEAARQPPTATESRNPRDFVGYLAEESFLSNTCGPDTDNVEPIDAESGLREGDSLLAVPPQPLLDAFIDAYFMHLFPLVPVVDRCDVMAPRPPTLLLHCISMLGSQLRGQRQPSIPTPESFYRKIKVLLYRNYETDSLTTLKCLCLIACRSGEPPTLVSLDSPWHWLGVATRYAFNMGLHRETTYQGRPAAGISRRIWWHLFNQDKLQSLCYGRPPAIRLNETDVQLPTLQDFASPHADNEVFIQRTNICVILGKISDAQFGRHQQSMLEEVISIGERLKQWIDELPGELQLYRNDETRTRAPYRRAASQLHIMYFTCIILFYRLVDTPQFGVTPFKVSVVAASCIVQLFREMYYRNDISSLLPINNWYCMAASVSLIYAQVKFPEDGPQRREELEMLRLVLREMVVISPSTYLILNNIDRIERSVLATPGVDLPARPSLRLGNGTTGSVDRDAMLWSRFRLVEPAALFPFPSSLCPSMHLLPALNAGSRDDTNYPVGVEPPLLAERPGGAAGPANDAQFLFLNSDFGNVQLDEFVMPDPPFPDTDIPSFDQDFPP